MTSLKSKLRKVEEKSRETGKPESQTRQEEESKAVDNVAGDNVLVKAHVQQLNDVIGIHAFLLTQNLLFLNASVCINSTGITSRCHYTLVYIVGRGLWIVIYGQLFIEPTCDYPRWALMHIFLSVSSLILSMATWVKVRGYIGQGQIRIPNKDRWVHNNIKVIHTS